jgi:hypothetical protein
MKDAVPPEHSDAAVPDVVRRYFEAHDRRDTDAALSSFTANAKVVDDGHDYVGSGAIRHWLAKASTEFTPVTRPVPAFFRFRYARESYPISS